MKRKRKEVRRVLAVFPSTWGFGFAVFEGPLRPIDWGVKCVRGKSHGDHLEKFRALLTWYRPDVLVIENYAGSGSRKSKRVEWVIRAMARTAGKDNVKLASYSRSLIRQAFSAVGAHTKYEIATAIAASLPELAPRVPKRRKLWTSEGCRMSIFDAASLALTFFHFEHVRHIAGHG